MKVKFPYRIENQTFTQGNAILKLLEYKPSEFLFQHLTVKEKVEKTEVKRMRTSYGVDNSFSVEIQENVKVGGEVSKV